MRKLLSLILVLSITPAFSTQGIEWEITNASRTNSVDTTGTIPLTDPGDVLVSVIVGGCSAPGGVLTIYDSSQTATGIVAAIDTSSTSTAGPTLGVRDCRRQYNFFLHVSSAITYTNTGSADVTFLWNNLRQK